MARSSLSAFHRLLAHPTNFLLPAGVRPCFRERQPSPPLAPLDPIVERLRVMPVQFATEFEPFQARVFRQECTDEIVELFPTLPTLTVDPFPLLDMRSTGGDRTGCHQFLIAGKLGSNPQVSQEYPVRSSQQKPRVRSAQFFVGVAGRHVSLFHFANATINGGNLKKPGRRSPGIRRHKFGHRGRELIARNNAPVIYGFQCCINERLQFTPRPSFWLDLQRRRVCQRKLEQNPVCICKQSREFHLPLQEVAIEVHRFRLRLDSLVCSRNAECYHSGSKTRLI